MKRHYLLILLFSAFLTFFAASLVQATPAMDALQGNVNRVLEVLRDPKLKTEAARETKRERLRKLAENMFDEIELARRVLARNWNDFSVPQRQEFVQLFRQILEGAYMDRILDYSDERIVFEREVPLRENQVEIRTRVIMPSKDVPILYRMINKEGTWRIYDVIVENVSLVQNYRTQFNEILARNPPEHLLDTLRKKVRERK
jgi:phospholipid transport system substrate-binding protein